MITRRTIKVLSLFLAAAMATVTAASCSVKKTSVNNPGQIGSTGENPDTSGESESEQLVEKLYGNRKNDYDGRIFRIIASEECWGSSIGNNANEVWFEDAGSDLLQRSIYERNHKTEELLGITITPVWDKTSEEIYDRVISDNNSGVNEYDAVNITLALAITCAQNGSAINLLRCQTFDESHPWWNQTFVEQCTLFGTQLYPIAGAINYGDDLSNRMVIFNQDFLDRYGCGDPYQYVFDGTWTIENMMAMAQKCTQDINGDGEMDENDNWGVGSGGMTLYDNLVGMDTAVSNLGEDGYPVILSKNEDHVTKVEYFFKNIIDTDYLYYGGITGSADVSYMDLFSNSQLAFGFVMLGSSIQLRGMDDYCGVLPMPKYNEEQTKYTSGANTLWFTTYIIPKSCTDPDYSAACLEVMSGYSVDTLDHNLNDVIFQSKVARDENARKCFDIIKDTLSFDWSFIGSWRGNLVSAYELKYGYSFTLVSRVESAYDAAQENLDVMIDAFRDRDY